MNPREENIPTKKEEAASNIPNNNIIYSTKFPATKITASRQWSNYKNPRIVRVSRAFGGKDRHSKVCTVRGLRDRRIRLSVPTAIQLYDLQDRLGLSQPSKVVDWLIDATKNDIDKLPPLPMLPQFQEPSNMGNPHHQYSHLGIFNNPTKEGINEQNNHEGFGGFVAQNLFPLNNVQSSFSNLHWDPPSLSLSQFGGGFSFPSSSTSTLTGDQDHDHHNNNIVSPALPSSSQLYFCSPSTNIIPPLTPSFSSYFNPPFIMDHNDHLMRSQISHLQQNSLGLPTTLQLISSPMKSLNLKGTVYSSQDTDKRDKEKRSS